jgi:hypothetical protein
MGPQGRHRVSRPRRSAQISLSETLSLTTERHWHMLRSTNLSKFELMRDRVAFLEV